MVKYNNKDRTAYKVAGVPVTAEQVQDMKDGDYVPGVNYDRLTDSDGGLVFKVEVG